MEIVMAGECSACGRDGKNAYKFQSGILMERDNISYPERE
jgi:hypothetical protein